MKRLRKINDEVKSLKENLEVLIEENHRYLTENSSLKMQVVALKTKLDKANKERAEFLNENIRLDNRLSELEKEIAELEDQLGG